MAEKKTSSAPHRSAAAAGGSPQPGTSRRPRKPRDSLNRAVIIEAAIRIVERDGLDGLTFQALGQELGAHSTSMYRHFRDKDELLLEVIDSLRERSYGGAMVPSDDWRQDLRMLAAHIRQHYLRYAPFAHEMSLRSTHRKIEFVNIEFTLVALERAGLTPEEAVVQARVLGNYIRAMSSFEASVGDLDPELRAKDRVQMQVDALSLDPSEFPHLSAAATSLLALDDPRVFEIGLEAILDGIERLGQASQAQGQRRH